MIYLKVAAAYSQSIWETRSGNAKCFFAESYPCLGGKSAP